MRSILGAVRPRPSTPRRGTGPARPSRAATGPMTWSFTAAPPTRRAAGAPWRRDDDPRAPPSSQPSPATSSPASTPPSSRSGRRGEPPPHRRLGLRAAGASRARRAAASQSSPAAGHGQQDPLQERQHTPRPRHPARSPTRDADDGPVEHVVEVHVGRAGPRGEHPVRRAHRPSRRRRSARTALTAAARAPAAGADRDDRSEVVLARLHALATEAEASQRVGSQPRDPPRHRPAGRGPRRPAGRAPHRVGDLVDARRRLPRAHQRSRGADLAARVRRRAAGVHQRPRRRPHVAGHALGRREPSLRGLARAGPAARRRRRRSTR